MCVVKSDESTYFYTYIYTCLLRKIDGKNYSAPMVNVQKLAGQDHMDFFRGALSKRDKDHTHSSTAGPLLRTTNIHVHCISMAKKHSAS